MEFQLEKYKSDVTEILTKIIEVKRKRFENVSRNTVGISL